jgi:hypothetical protein
MQEMQRGKILAGLLSGLTIFSAVVPAFAQTVPTPGNRPQLIDTRLKPSVVDILKNQTEAKKRVAQQQARAQKEKDAQALKQNQNDKQKKNGLAAKRKNSQPSRTESTVASASQNTSPELQKPLIPGRIGVEGALESWKPETESPGLRLEPSSMHQATLDGQAANQAEGVDNRLTFSGPQSSPISSNRIPLEADSSHFIPASNVESDAPSTNLNSNIQLQQEEGQKKNSAE